MIDPALGPAIDAVTDASFDAEVVASPTPVLVEFGASWCPPCRAMAPVLADVARERAGRLRVVTVDWDENHRHADRLGVMAVPTLFLFSNGSVVHRIAGYTAKPRLLRIVDELLAGRLPSR
jgi:thioredoxin 1